MVEGYRSGSGRGDQAGGAIAHFTIGNGVSYDVATVNDQLAHHYPPELMTLLVDGIPRLFKGKQKVLDFFKGCGVDPNLYADIQRTVNQDREGITKFEIVRQVLNRLNDKGDAALRARREILRRVTQWEDFTGCYENDRTVAEGFVAKIQKVVNVKDSFTRMNNEREDLDRENRRKREAEMAERQRVRQEREKIKADLFSLFSESNASKRGKALESVLNHLFKSHGILIREAFQRVGTAGEGVIEQIDGLVELDGHVYLVEMKWWAKPLGVGEVAEHLVRIFNRNAARGILISQSGYTEPAVTSCRTSLSKIVFALAKLEEIVLLLEREGSLVEMLRAKIRAAIADLNPLVEPLAGANA